MRKPSLIPKVADAAPTADTLTGYDEEHLITYLRLLDADTEGAEWAEVARIVLRIDPAQEPVRARRAYESHLARDPTIPARNQPIFWSPQVLPAVIPLTRVWEFSATHRLNISFRDLSSADIRRVSEGWYVFVRMGGIEHRILLHEPPVADAAYAATLAFDAYFELRAHAARRLWRALSGRPPGPEFRKQPTQRRGRLLVALRALDARLAGASYRTIAEALFGAERVPARAWKTHDLRNRTIRLVQSAQALMREGYFDLLRYPLLRR